jgi:hypothetical protein
LTYGVLSQNPEVGSAEVNGSVLRITPLSQGPLQVTIIAEDGTGGPTVGGQWADIWMQVGLNGDFNRDGEVGFADFLEFAGVFGQSSPAGSAEAKYDLDRSGDIGFGDFLIFAGVFGSTV